MDPLTGRPARGVLTVAVLAANGTAGDALDTTFFVLRADGSRAYLTQLPGMEVLFFLPESTRGWRMLRHLGGS
jgi:thiamine biosynthesis lipoprotein ApbE